MLGWRGPRFAAQLEAGVLASLEPKARNRVARTRYALGHEQTVRTFTFLGYDEGGMMIGPTGAHRLVCVADSGAKVVIFGHESELENINTVLAAGLPCNVRCETHPASQAANRYAGHTHWVWEYSTLEVVPSGVDREVL
jgi:hypothetical protein